MSSATYGQAVYDGLKTDRAHKHACSRGYACKPHALSLSSDGDLGGQRQPLDGNGQRQRVGVREGPFRNAPSLWISLL